MAVPAAPRTPRSGDWPDLLRELATQLDHGKIYDRDLRELTGALDQVLTAYRHLYR